MGECRRRDNAPTSGRLLPPCIQGAPTASFYLNNEYVHQFLHLTRRPSREGLTDDGLRIGFHSSEGNIHQPRPDIRLYILSCSPFLVDSGWRITRAKIAPTDLGAKWAEIGATWYPRVIRILSKVKHTDAVPPELVPAGRRIILLAMAIRGLDSADS